MLPEYVNNICRKYVSDKLDLFSKQYELSINIVSLIFVLEILNKLESNSKIDYVQSRMLFSILISDAYKILNHKFKNNNLVGDEILLYDFLEASDDIEYIIEHIKEDEAKLRYLIESTYNFYNMNSLGKRLLIKSLDEQNNNHLNKICVTHENDLIKYSEPITKEQIIKIYNLYKKHYQFDLNTVTFSDEKIILMIASYLRKIFDEDPSEYERVLSLLGDEDQTKSLEELIENTVKEYKYEKK